MNNLTDTTYHSGYNHTVLVTGGAGFIGSVLTQKLLNEGFRVMVLDSLIFGGEGLLPVYSNPNFEFIKGDVRDDNILDKALTGVSTVVHLAAIVGEPLCNRIPEAAFQINQEATGRLVDLCREKGIKRFVFSSTCSNYGVSDSGAYVDEDAPLKPISLYSETKVKSESYVLESKSENFHPCVLRFATVYGISPRMRFDLLLHELISDAVVKKKLTLYGAKYWRPLVHINDVANACLKAIISSPEKINGKVYNVGNNNENYTKLMLAEMIKEQIPKAKVELLENKIDTRNYRVSFTKIADELGFQTTKTVKDGIADITDAIAKGVFHPADPKYTNLSSMVDSVSVY